MILVPEGRVWNYGIELTQLWSSNISYNMILDTSLLFWAEERHHAACLTMSFKKDLVLFGLVTRLHKSSSLLLGLGCTVTAGNQSILNVTLSNIYLVKHQLCPLANARTRAQLSNDLSKVYFEEGYDKIQYLTYLVKCSLPISCECLHRDVPSLSNSWCCHNESQRLGREELKYSWCQCWPGLSALICIVASNGTHNYGKTVRSVAFAGTVVGMVIFGSWKLTTFIFVHQIIIRWPLPVLLLYSPVFQQHRRVHTGAWVEYWRWSMLYSMFQRKIHYLPASLSWTSFLLGIGGLGLG